MDEGFSEYSYSGFFLKQRGIKTCTGPPDPNGQGAGLRRTEYYEEQKNIIIGISETRCTCVVEDMTVFIQAPASACTMRCVVFSNPLCGGDGDASSRYWGRICVQSILG